MGRSVSFERKSQGYFEVKYARVQDMEPTLQRNLLDALRRDSLLGQVCVLFYVETLEVPRSVPEFWLNVTRELSPGCARSPWCLTVSPCG